MSDQITVKEYVAEKLMHQSGYTSKDENPLEWDASREDSQYSILLDVAEAAIDATMEALDLIDKEHHEEQFPKADEEDAVYSSNTTYVFLDNNNKVITVGDVRKWLAEVDGLNTPDHFAVEGYLHLMFDENLQLISKDHPSLSLKSDSEVRQLELDAARKKIDYLIGQGEYAEAERFINFLRKEEEEK